MRTPCVVSQGGRWHIIMKLNSSCHESCLNLKTRQSPGDWTVSYAQLLECHQITLFFQKVNESFVQNLDVVTVILKWSSNIMRNWPWPQLSPKCGWKCFLDRSQTVLSYGFLFLFFLSIQNFNLCEIHNFFFFLPQSLSHPDSPFLT